MWCKNCNIETNESICPICGAATIEDIPVEIFWCSDCVIPVIHLSNSSDKGICPICGKKTHYLASDLRPVFPEERLLLAILLDKEPNAYITHSIWASGSRYYIDGKPISIPAKTFETADTDIIAEKISNSSALIDYTPFDKEMQYTDLSML